MIQSIELRPSNIVIWIICDDPDTGHTWTRLLSSKGFDVRFASSYGLLTNSEEDSPDLIIIDETTSELNGISIIEKVKSLSGALILYLTSQNDEHHVLKAYQSGVDECVVKPISPALFLYRVRALLRRAQNSTIMGLQNIKTQEFLLDPSRRIVQMTSGKQVRLSVLEFRLFHLLISNPGRVFESEQIIHSVWGYSETGNKSLLKHLVFRLRQKVEVDPNKPKWIKTEAGVGYKFEEE